MKQYDVKISRMALSDMEQIYSYIADRLLESDTAMRQYDRIAEAIQSLNILPEGDTANAIPTDLVGHRSGSLAGLPVSSLSSSEFLVPGDASLLNA